MTHRAFIAIGSNLGPRHATIHAGLRDLARVPGIRVVRLSSLIQTDPVGPPGQGPYLNAAAELATTLDPHTLLDAMLAVERAHGRDRSGSERWGPRTLDLDLLWYDGVTLDEPGLTLPHPRMADRPFVLRPLAEIAPDLPVGRTVRAALRRLAED
ncbi:MAG: 2-amino-4-hydroxy-6-hydroxymethyldihydropteridine diphosphokinase [Phycisphaerales bacterium]|nr:2-amino-4-hydroxy-6-hydroxymethyldihydropteridine diphosphokinase [Planctomycetota bacterium]MCH8508515.1 2-amino-4-hydroxy-6-hydroxymethyldihydropteridine diphosphokinase [Phycisphaerales bacterium]